MSDLKELEPQICDLDNMATIAANLLNNVSAGQTPDGDFVIRKHDLELMTFAVNEAETRAAQLRKAFYASIREGKKHD
ncbi:MAG: hypothetical protein RIB57_13690 [Pelagibacterium sp.]|uniref:hypothetical protein n=1 Tax=Pelagibacterium sp. TaxID=1967288 RepID=UPI0032EDABE7